MRVITGSAKGISLKTPEGLQTRPTTDRVKEALFSIIQFEIEGRRVLDLFAGTGQLGIEALSRGADRAILVDAGRDAVALIKENLRRTKLLDKAQVIQCDYLEYLSRCRERFDVIFLDPPYAEVFLENALRKISEIDILSSSGIIICERPAEKTKPQPVSGFSEGKDYRYGKTFLTLYRKCTDAEEL